MPGQTELRLYNSLTRCKEVFRPLVGNQLYRKYGEAELRLLEAFTTIKADIHSALCDSIDTRTVVEKMRELINLLQRLHQRSQRRKADGQHPPAEVDCGARDSLAEDVRSDRRERARWATRPSSRTGRASTGRKC
ncbi:Cysteinyl-tRNA synthetase [Aphelenchoides fujianensis]|nr:Cysteinyl-tRNA synthetase [Aphelenchoides fujianensis]